MLLTVPERALVFAHRAHRGQVRKYNGEPYICHPIRVAALLVKHDSLEVTFPILAAAYLHDVVEDCGIRLAAIREEFGDETAVLVEWVTDEFTKENYPMMNRKTRKGAENERLAAAPFGARLIKGADILDNAGGMDEKDDFADVWAEEKFALLNAWVEARCRHSMVVSLAHTGLCNLQSRRRMQVQLETRR